mmetsp:Transcript_118096/g.345909  ORF Transcript_118096/g.345909 Transcript_118096/m.345909 type:complete len:238 (-) Transcript_118096:78-791(-)
MSRCSLSVAGSLGLTLAVLCCTLQGCGEDDSASAEEAVAQLHRCQEHLHQCTGSLRQCGESLSQESAMLSICKEGLAECRTANRAVAAELSNCTRSLGHAAQECQQQIERLADSIWAACDAKYKDPAALARANDRLTQEREELRREIDRLTQEKEELRRGNEALEVALKAMAASMIISAVVSVMWFAWRRWRGRAASRQLAAPLFLPSAQQATRMQHVRPTAPRPFANAEPEAEDAS